jgi:hypothetical protein
MEIKNLSKYELIKTESISPERLKYTAWLEHFPFCKQAKGM